MNWSRLKDSKCPQCQGELGKPVASLYSCQKNCGFTISKERFNELVESIYKPKKSHYRVPNEDENLAALNVLGHDEMTEDFSDSDFLDI